jgi:hypothetical protein
MTTDSEMMAMDYAEAAARQRKSEIRSRVSAFGPRRRSRLLAGRRRTRFGRPAGTQGVSIRHTPKAKTGSRIPFSPITPVKGHMTGKQPAMDMAHEDFQRLLILQKRHNDVLSALHHLASEMDTVHRDWLNKIVDGAVVVDAERQWIEAEAETICRRHGDDWFADRQSLKTPLGTARFHRSTALEVPSEALTMELLQARDGKVLDAGEAPLVAGNYLRVERSLNLDALGTLPDAVLVALKVRRIARESFALVPASADIGKAVKEAAKKGKEDKRRRKQAARAA